jgi:L-ascorbate metabolism protein UlaG (beta-lactamase superfamily)
VLRQRVLHIRRRVPPPAVEELHSLDGIVISHPHHDHLDPPSLRMVTGDCPVIAPRGCRWTVRRGGAKKVIEVEVGDRVEVGGTCVEAVPARHDGRRFPVGRQRPALGYLLEGPPGFYFAGDTDLFPEMGELAGRVDVAALPIGGWGPKVPAGHLDPERAARAAALIQPQIVIPIHWGTLSTGPGGSTERSRAPEELVDAVARAAPRVDVRVLAPGQRLGF